MSIQKYQFKQYDILFQNEIGPDSRHGLVFVISLQTRYKYHHPPSHLSFDKSSKGSKNNNLGYFFFKFPFSQTFIYGTIKLFAIVKTLELHMYEKCLHAYATPRPSPRLTNRWFNN